MKDDKQVFFERIKNHPSLMKRFEEILNIAENSSGELITADEAEGKAIEEVKKLRAGIREHRDSTGQELCWHHPEPWELLPEKIDPEISVPDWPEFMKGCIRYRQSLEEQNP